MKKHHRRHHAHIGARLSRKPANAYLTVVRGWMFIVAFALMLGLGAIAGNFLQQKLNETTPAVAGAQIEAR